MNFYKIVSTVGELILLNQVTIALARRDLSVLFANEKEITNEVFENGEVIAEEEEKQEPKKKSLPWQKNKGKRATNKKGSKKPMKKEVEDKKKTAAASSKTAKAKEEESESCSEVEAEDEVELDESDDGEAEAANNDGSLPEKDDDQLEKLQSDVAMRRQRLLEGKSQFSHSVYCPFYPEDKQEYWWAYITDRKQQMLLTAPYHITNLVEHEEIQLKFTAPFKPGFYTFAVCLRSDSYFGFDQMKDIKVYSG